MVGVELLQHLVGVDVHVRGGSKLLVAQLTVVIGVELLELGLEPLLDRGLWVLRCAVSARPCSILPS